ncbi:MAG: TIGR00730 family Rossman fold protein [Clostridia bacterium]|nr:TIGR00730 family Rossman fold protein [Clostridia bacterium]
MNICVYGASSDAIDKKYIAAGEALGEEMARRGHTLIFGGGACGLMGAVARGMSRENGKIIGIAPSFFNVDGVLYDKCDEFIYTETMRERKQIMEDRADAFIMTPGGIGTFEEFFEIFTLKQLGRLKKAIAVLNTGGYYDAFSDLMKRTADEHFMQPQSLTLYSLFESSHDMLDYIETYSCPDIDIRDMKYIEK